MDRYTPLFEESLTIAGFFKYIEVVGDQFLQLHLAVFEGIRECAGAQFEASAHPIATFLFEAEREGDIS